VPMPATCMSRDAPSPLKHASIPSGPGLARTGFVLGPALPSSPSEICSRLRLDVEGCVKLIDLIPSLAFCSNPLTANSKNVGH